MGTAESLQMKIDTFREFYKPYYQRIINACHERSIHFIWHNCGYIDEMFPDMIEMGVDVVQFDQPRLIGHQKLIEALGGKICMWNCVDIQWASKEEVTNDEIRREVAEMVQEYESQDSTEIYCQTLSSTFGIFNFLFKRRKADF